MRRFLVVAGILSLLAYRGYGLESITDTVKIEEVTSTVILKKYQSGAKIEKISPIHFELEQDAGIDKMLMRFTPIYIKSMAGGLSTIRLRGTSPNHTSINFGGINVNSLTLGHSNMSNIPAYLFDDLSLQYGSASAVNGSGSVGGALHLGLKGYWTNGVRVKSRLSVGSFGEHLYGSKIYAGNGKFESISRLYFYKKENDFPFCSDVWDFEKKEYKKGKQSNSKIENKGLIQEFNFKLKERQTFNTSIWFEEDWHEIQPNMGKTLSGALVSEEIKNKNIRIWSEYKDQTHKIKPRLGIGFVHDKQVYDGDEYNIIQTDRLVCDAEIEHGINPTTGYKIGVKYKYMVPDVYSYADSAIDNEQHLDIYLSYFKYLFRKLKLTMNLRQQYVTNYNVPFTPSLGAEYVLFNNGQSSLRVNSNISHSYRIPTFNDRFWGDQGNPNLKPEKGKNFEAGVNYVFGNENFQTNIKLNSFYMDIDNWIQWRLSDKWRAKNVMEVVSKGIEFQTKTDISAGEFNFTTHFNYSLNSVESVESADVNALLNEQIIYVPKHSGNISFITRYKQFQWFLDGSYTGLRYTNDLKEGRGRLGSYFIANTGLVYKMEIHKQKVNFSFSVNNLFDKNYQNEKNYAMPRRSYRFGISTDLNIINLK